VINNGFAGRHPRKARRNHVKKSLAAVLLVAFSLPVFAQDGVLAAPGKPIVTSTGARLGAVHRVTEDGSAQLIIDGKVVTIPASTLSLADGKLTTSLSKADVRKLH
jgi:hypothetical protein